MLNELRTDNLILRRILEKDRQFISEVFNDDLVKKFYIIPKEAQQNPGKIVDYWLNDIYQEAGFAWIIQEKRHGLFSTYKSCGFFAFEFRNTVKNARISYALKPEFRANGITYKVATIIIEALKDIGITSFEADIDEDNVASENVIKRLGFTTNRKVALIDPEILRDNNIRIRFLWKKELIIESIKPGYESFSKIDISRDSIENWLNKTFLGNQFNKWIYDESEPIEILNKKGYPFTMACFEVNPEILISVGMDRGDQTPKMFIAENQNNSFVMNNSIPSKVLDTIYGRRIVYYAKKV